MSPWGRRQQGRCAPACGGAGPPRCPGGPRGEPPLTTTIRVSFMNFEGLEIFFQNLVFLRDVSVFVAVCRELGVDARRNWSCSGWKPSKT